MSDWYVGEIRLFSMGWAPSDWHLCDGSLLQMSQNAALYSLIGTTFGGDGRTTFALPDLRGRALEGSINLYPQGQRGGTERVTLNVAQMPMHTHYMSADATNGVSLAPSGNYLAQPVTNGGAAAPLYVAGGNTVALNPESITSSGTGGDHDNMQPYLVQAYCIAIAGLYPPRP